MLLSSIPFIPCTPCILPFSTPWVSRGSCGAASLFGTLHRNLLGAFVPMWSLSCMSMHPERGCGAHPGHGPGSAVGLTRPPCPAGAPGRTLPPGPQIPPTCLGELLRGHMGGSQGRNRRGLGLPSRALSTTCQLRSRGVAEIAATRIQKPSLDVGDCGRSPARSALARFWEGGGQDLPACAVGPGVAAVSWCDTQPPVPAGCARGPHKAWPQHPTTRLPLPFFLLSFPPLLFLASYPEVVGTMSLPLLKTHEP